MNPHTANLTRIAVDLSCEEFGTLTELIRAFPAPGFPAGLAYVIAEPGPRSWLIPGDVVTCVSGDEAPRVVSVDSFANGFLASFTLVLDEWYWPYDVRQLAERWEALGGQTLIDDDQTVTGYWPHPASPNFRSDVWEVSRKAPGYHRFLSLPARVGAVNQRLLPAPAETVDSGSPVVLHPARQETFRWLREMGTPLTWSTYLATGDWWTAIEERRHGKSCVRSSAEFSPAP